MKRVIIIILLFVTLAYSQPMMCRNKTYIAEIDKIATQGEISISLTAQLMRAPLGTIFDGNNYPDRYVIEYTPDANVQRVTFEILITFDPNYCVEQPTRTWLKTYEVIDPIPAPEIPIRPFVVKE